jgi:hypothetical protein
VGFAEAHALWLCLGTLFVLVGIRFLVLLAFLDGVPSAFSWCVAVAALIKGGDRPSISRARRALLLAGMPWYCLVLYLSTYL